MTATDWGVAESLGHLLTRLRTMSGRSQLRLAELLCAAAGRWSRWIRWPARQSIGWTTVAGGVSGGSSRSNGSSVTGSMQPGSAPAGSGRGGGRSGGHRWCVPGQRLSGQTVVPRR